MSSIGRVHLITDHRPGRDVLDVVTAALAAGVDTVQVRVADETSDREAYELTRRVLRRCRDSRVTCLVNDRVDVALAAGADGCHLGAEDLPLAVAREVLGSAALLGATARDPQTAREAVRDGADYLGTGPVYATVTKDGLPDPLGPAGLRAVAGSVPVPVVAVGGLSAERVAEVREAGAHGVAVVGAISAAPDPYAAAAALVRAWELPGGAVAQGAFSRPGEGARGAVDGVRVVVNGHARLLATGTTVHELVEDVLGLPLTGIAVAVNETVVPSTRWDQHRLGHGDSVEVLTALQGG